MCGPPVFFFSSVDPLLLGHWLLLCMALNNSFFCSPPVPVSGMLVIGMRGRASVVLRVESSIYLYLINWLFCRNGPYFSTFASEFSHPGQKYLDEILCAQNALSRRVMRITIRHIFPLLFLQIFGLVSCLLLYSFCRFSCWFMSSIQCLIYYPYFYCCHVLC